MGETERINYSYCLRFEDRVALTVAEIKRAGWRGRL